MESFWNRLAKPFFVVAPMADVTDAAFRRMIAKYSAHTRADGTVGGPDVMWTEFVSADGLARAPEEGRKKLLADLMYADIERPIIAQLFSSNPEYMEQAARLCRELGFDGVDINMGCPDRSIEKQGAGAAHIKDPARAVEVIRAAMQGAGHGNGGIPVSVKTRLGYNDDILETWLPTILATNPGAVTVHARTRKDMSKVPARWERIARAVEIRNQCQGDTLTSSRIIGNGDALTMEDARTKAEESGADGVMIGRALFGNPWFFHPTRRLPQRLTALPTHGVNRDTIVTTDTTHDAFEYIDLEERFRVMVEHTRLFAELLPHKSFAVMKKHFKAYVSGFDGAHELRNELMESNTPDEVERIVARFLSV
jgi:nifR3 family TIM-barrel protein